MRLTKRGRAKPVLYVTTLAQQGTGAFMRLWIPAISCPLSFPSYELPGFLHSIWSSASLNFWPWVLSMKRVSIYSRYSISTDWMARCFLKKARCFKMHSNSSRHCWLLYYHDLEETSWVWCTSVYNRVCMHANILTLEEVARLICWLPCSLFPLC